MHSYFSLVWQAVHNTYFVVCRTSKSFFGTFKKPPLDFKYKFWICRILSNAVHCNLCFIQNYNCHPWDGNLKHLWFIFSERGGLRWGYPRYNVQYYLSTSEWGMKKLWPHNTNLLMGSWTFAWKLIIMFHYHEDSHFFFIFIDFCLYGLMVIGHSYVISLIFFFWLSPQHEYALSRWSSIHWSKNLLLCI